MGVLSKSVLQASSDDPNRATRTLRWLLVALVLLPLTVFVVGSAISYRQHIADAAERQKRDLNTIYEHALKAFETFELTARYLDVLLAGVTDDQISASEGAYNAQLKAIADTLPQLADIWIIDADGFPRVSGTVFPIPRKLNLSDRKYFRVHKNNEVDGIYIDEVVQARATNDRGRPWFFALSRKRPSRDGRFAGVMTISVSPEYFSDYYATLPLPGSEALIREDGAILARYPGSPEGGRRLPPHDPLMQAIRTSPKAGVATGRSTIDGMEKTFAFRRLPRHGIYVVSGHDTRDIVRTWAWSMSYHLIFGIPATLAIIGLGLTALRRSRREALANTQLREEILRRERTEQSLRQAQKMDAVGRLTGGVAHDFNNLLTVIAGNIELAQRRLNPEGLPRLGHLLSSAREASRRAATLVERLLAFSRQHPMESKAVDINRLVQGMSELLRRTIGANITIETVLAGGLWKVAIDPNQLENAILNLCVNARDSMPNGGRLTLETSNSHLDEAYAAAAGDGLSAGQFVMLAISDAGTGMSDEVMDRAFEPFFTTKPAGAGTGLGLSMVYGFVKQSGGHIKIYSEIGEGTTIKLYFPRLLDTTSVPAWRQEQSEPATTAQRPNEVVETILLVEDEEQVCEFGREALEDRGYRVLTAADGTSALKILDTEQHLDLLFTDVILPGGMNGRQLADEVRRRRPGLKVLYATGYTRNAIIHQGRLDPGVELLTKPFTADALTLKVRQILDNEVAAPVSPPLADPT